MPFPAAIDFEARTGRLYRSEGGQLTVLFPWPEMCAFSRPLSGTDWRPAGDPRFELAPEPELNLGDPFSRYCAAIPDDVVAAVRPYQRNHWRLLAWIARSGPGARDLAVSNPALAFMVASYEEFEEDERRRAGPAPLMLAYRKQREILGWLGFPATESVRRLVRKIVHTAIDLWSLRALRTRLRDEEIAGRLAHASRINYTLMRMTAHGTVTWLTPRFIARVAAADCACPVIPAGMLADTVRMWTLLRPDAPRPSFDSETRVRAAHDELSDELGRARVRICSDETATFSAPLQGTDTIIPLTTAAMLRHEGRSQHNCVASYARRVEAGLYAVYRVLEPERCTLGLMRRGKRWELDQVKGFANAPVSFETAAAVRGWLNGARKGPGAAAPAPGLSTTANAGAVVPAAAGAGPARPAPRRRRGTGRMYTPLLWAD